MRCRRRPPDRRAAVPNVFAIAVLSLWPLVAAFAFRTLPVNRAVPWCALCGYLLLPSGFTVDLPGLPDLNKESTVLIGIVVVYFRHRRPARHDPLPRVTALLIGILLTQPLFTALTNGDPLESRWLYIPGMTPYDAVGMVFSNGLMAATVVIGARTLSRTEDHRGLLALFGAAMVLYSLPTLLELRISPQLHHWIYGFHPSAFVQQVRGDGYRATVFLTHGLALALCLALASCALMALRRSQVKIFGFRPQVLSSYLFVVLILQKSLGALMIGSFVSLMLLFTRPRRQIALAAAVAGIFLSYPVLRAADAIPIDWLNRTVAGYSEDRAQSFTMRTSNEQALLAKANERPLFGWGTWGRNRVYDFQAGVDVSVTDGAWIIILSSFGWAGYFGIFGLLSLPLLMLFRHRRQMPAETAGLALLLAANLIDLIPNASLTPLTWLMAGALTGAVAAARRKDSPVIAAPETGSPALA